MISWEDYLVDKCIVEEFWVVDKVDKCTTEEFWVVHEEGIKIPCFGVHWIYYNSWS